MNRALGGNVLDWIDGRIAWQFLGILYVARWAVLLPIMALAPLVFSRAGGRRFHPSGNAPREPLSVCSSPW